MMLPGQSIQDFRSCLPSRFYQIMIFGVGVDLVVCTVTLEYAAKWHLQWWLFSDSCSLFVFSIYLLYCVLQSTEKEV